MPENIPCVSKVSNELDKEFNMRYYYTRQRFVYIIARRKMIMKLRKSLALAVILSMLIAVPAYAAIAYMNGGYARLVCDYSNGMRRCDAHTENFYDDQYASIYLFTTMWNGDEYEDFSGILPVMATMHTNWDWAESYDSFHSLHISSTAVPRCFVELSAD